MRKGEELKAPHYASAAALYDDYIIIYNIIPNSKLVRPREYYRSKIIFKIL